MEKKSSAQGRCDARENLWLPLRPCAVYGIEAPARLSRIPHHGHEFELPAIGMV